MTATAALCLPYMPAAVASWPAFRVKSITDNALTAILDTHLLKPTAMSRVCNRLVELKYSSKAVSMAAHIDQVDAFVAQNPHDDFLLQETDLQEIEGHSNGHKPSAKHAYITDIRLRSLLSSMKSMRAMAVVEYILAPRTLVDSAALDCDDRFDTSSQFMRAFSKILTRFSTRESSVAEAVQLKLPADDIKEAVLEAWGPFFADLLCPLGVIDFTFVEHSTKSASRLRAVDKILEWAYPANASSRDIMLQQNFNSFVLGFENVATIVTPATSAMSAYQAADRLRIELVPSSSSMSVSALSLTNSRLISYMNLSRTSMA